MEAPVTMTASATTRLEGLTLPWLGVRPLTFLLGLIGAAVLLPAIAHVLQLPVRWLLPMHWPVILAGLVYGWRAGVVAGLLSPLVSFALSGMPPQPFLPTMTAELAAYGLLAGVLRSSVRMNAFASVALALVAGRLVAIGASLVLGAALPALLPTYGPGVPAALAQVVLLPLLAAWWVRSERAARGNREDGP
jgi:hypothetical protein